MSVSLMKEAFTNSQNQRPCVSRKWVNEGLGLRKFRSHVQSSAAGTVKATESVLSDKTRATHDEKIGTKQESIGSTLRSDDTRKSQDPK